MSVPAEVPRLMPVTTPTTTNVAVSSPANISAVENKTFENRKVVNSTLNRRSSASATFDLVVASIP